MSLPDEGRYHSNLVHNVYQFRMASPWLLYPTHCTTSISCLALYAFCVFRCVHCIRGFHCLDLDFVNTAYATEATEIHTIVSISSFGVTFRWWFLRFGRYRFSNPHTAQHSVISVYTRRNKHRLACVRLLSICHPASNRNLDTSGHSECFIAADC